MHSYLWNFAREQKPQCGNPCPSEAHSENTKFINLISNRLENKSIINYNKPEDTEICYEEFLLLPCEERLGMEEEEERMSVSVSESEETAESAFMKFIRQENLEKVIAGLQGSRASNKLKIQHLVIQLEEQRTQNAKSEGFFASGSKVSLPAKPCESLFDNEIPEKDVLYNLKSFFKIENRYIQLQEQRMNVSSNRKIIEYNSGSFLIRDPVESKLQSLQRRDRLPGVQFGRLLRPGPYRVLFSKLTSSATSRSISRVTECSKSPRATGFATYALNLATKESTCDVLCAIAEEACCVVPR